MENKTADQMFKEIGYVKPQVGFENGIAYYHKIDGDTVELGNECVIFSDVEDSYKISLPNDIIRAAAKLIIEMEETK